MAGVVAASGVACLALFGTGSSALSSPAQIAATGTPDLTSLPLGDGKSTTSGPSRDHLYLCRLQQGGSGAQVDGPWIHGSTYDLTAKSTVDGSVDWPGARFRAKIKKKVLRITGNGLPKHTTGVFPVSPSDDAYKVDRNPNSIRSYTLAEKLTAKPKKAKRITCAGGEVGIMRSGVKLFNAVDAGGKDAVAHEVQDNCSGHPQMQGVYHYHGLPACISTSTPQAVAGDRLGTRRLPDHGPARPRRRLYEQRRSRRLSRDDEQDQLLRQEAAHLPLRRQLRVPLHRRLLPRDPVSSGPP